MKLPKGIKCTIIVKNKKGEIYEVTFISKVDISKLTIKDIIENWIESNLQNIIDWDVAYVD